MLEFFRKPLHFTVNSNQQLVYKSGVQHFSGCGYAGDDTCRVLLTFVFQALDYGFSRHGDTFQCGWVEIDNQVRDLEQSTGMRHEISPPTR